MAVTLDNIHEDMRFYDELKQYVFEKELDPVIEAHNRWMVDNGLLQIESLLEIAISNVNGIKRAAVHGMDYIDGSDAKKVTSSWRNNNKIRGEWTNSFKITNINNKRGLLRAMCFNRVLSRFQYYAIPYSAYAHLTGDSLDITLESYRGCFNEPMPRGEGTKSKWDNYRKSSFIEMANTKD